MARPQPHRLLVGAILSVAATLAIVVASGAAGAPAATGLGPGRASGDVPEPTNVVKGSATSRAGLRPTVDRFRDLLGPDNGGAPGSNPTGRRELNWDGVPDELASPNALPPDFFNATEAPRARGVVLLTPGRHVAVSADRDNPADAAARFGDINPTYRNQFRTFSPERLFSPLGSNVVNLRFYVPGTNDPALVRGFGAVYTDVDRRETASFEYFDANGRSLGRFSVPRSPAGLSFLGVVFSDPVVARVRIKYGNRALGPTETKRYDVAVMPDFIYAEPQPVSP